MIASTSDNTAYTLQAYALALRDIALFGRNVVYAENAIRYCKNKNMQVIYLSSSI